jgi:hypothetical protein
MVSSAPRPIRDRHRVPLPVPTVVAEVAGAEVVERPPSLRGFRGNFPNIVLYGREYGAA